MKKIQVILFWVATFFLFFFQLRNIPLWSSDEGRYGEVAREMWESRNFIVPHFNYLPFLDKPILAPALTAVSYTFLGINAFATRLPIALSAIFGIAFFYCFSKKLFDKETAFFSSILLLTTTGYFLVGRFAVIDMLMTCFLSLALFCLMTACLAQKPRYYLAAYTFMGLAFLTKGLIGIVLPSLIFFSFLVWTKNLRELGKTKIWLGAIIIAAITLPWIVIISKKEPEFFNTFIVKQHFSRFATGTFGRKRPIWFFLPILIGTAFPWTLFAPAAVLQGMKQSLSKQKIQFLLCWIAVIFVFFSIPKSKLPYYLLPLSMPMALLIGNFFVHGLFKKELVSKISPLVEWPWKIIAGISLLAAMGLNIALFWIHMPEVELFKPILHISSAVLLAGGLGSYIFYKKNQTQSAAFSLAGMVYASLILVILAMKTLSPFQSSAGEAAILKPLLKENTLVAIFSSPDHFSDLPFHLQKRVVVVGTDRGTLDEQSNEPRYAQDTKEYFLATEQFVGLFNLRNRPVVCLMEEEEKFDEIIKQGLKNYRILQRAYGKILLANF